MASIVTVLGTRPEVIKLSSLLPLLNQRWSHALVHTGQHYDEEMVNVFFHDLKLPPPDYTLTVGSGSHAKQIAQIILRLEEILPARRGASRHRARRHEHNVRRGARRTAIRNPGGPRRGGVPLA